MPNVSQGNQKGTSKSGHGALGMGGQPSDDPRDLESGRDELPNEDRTRPVDGAFGAGDKNHAGGGSSNNVIGVQGDKDAADIK